VSLEFLKGTWGALLARALMQSPRAESDLLIDWASLNLSPEAADLEMRSEPARSHSQSLALQASPASFLFP
jgi:hypothetical protein